MDNFLETHKLFEAGPAQAISVEPGAPEELRTLLAQAAGGLYARGFWCFAPAARLRPFLFSPRHAPEECIPFLKAAFGHLIFLHRGRYLVWNPVDNVVDELGAQGDLDFVIDILLCDRRALEGTFRIDVYEQAVERLGPPGIDELYAFVPALRLGGSRDPACVEKRPMRTELPLLAQL
jgi:hypothetical protein